MHPAALVARTVCYSGLRVTRTRTFTMSLPIATSVLPPLTLELVSLNSQISRYIRSPFIFELESETKRQKWREFVRLHIYTCTLFRARHLCRCAAASRPLRVSIKPRTIVFTGEHRASLARVFIFFSRTVCDSFPCACMRIL